MAFGDGDLVLLDPAFLPTSSFITHVQVSCQLSVAALLFFDSVITIDDEVKYFWSTPYSSAHLIYFSNKYIGLLCSLGSIYFRPFHATEPLCELFLLLHTSGLVTTLLVDYILLLRVLALYQGGNVKKVIWGLRLLYILQGAVRTFLLVKTRLYEKIAVGAYSMSASMAVCGFLRVVPQIWVDSYWTIPLCFELTLAIMILIKAIGFWSINKKKFGLINVLVQDQVFFLVLVLISSTLQILANQPKIESISAPYILGAIGSPLILSTIGNRLLFHLKDEAERSSFRSESDQISTLSALEFA
ncbi:hypothetical protein PNOK_0942000 [Pyrrhoderma noxium]|uniref:DUF6533 domain-containing protein n=1 Tax=Pyrrhoderma noxium TaxID=2282107 RepID=A0A286U5N0_9AGAM|nr:hypothetical protein PNOK_0942000 [Pyrrhoderma noxium]